MLGQVINESVRAFGKDGFKTSVVIPFGTIVFVACFDRPRGKAKIIHEDVIYEISEGSLKLLDSEKDLLTWEQVLQLEEARRLKNEEAINNLFVE